MTISRIQENNMKTLILIMIALSLTGRAHSAEDPVRYDVSLVTVDEVFICRIPKEEKSTLDIDF